MTKYSNMSGKIINSELKILTKENEKKGNIGLFLQVKYITSFNINNNLIRQILFLLYGLGGHDSGRYIMCLKS